MVNFFEVKKPDFDLSPYTGLTRQNWIDAGVYLLEGMFENLESIESAPVVPRSEMKVTYPHIGAPDSQIEAERRAEIFEGLTRTFFIGSVLIHENPEIEIGGIKLRDYYSLHILRALTDEKSPEYVSTYDELVEITGSDDPSRCFQQTVETCALVIGLWACKDEIWNRYSKEEKDSIASFLQGYAKAPTVPQNWRLFNMLDMAFLHMEGYEIDEHIMREHAQAILSYYAGNGWFRDGHSFDYYSCWAFNVYAPIWNVWYGYENEPYIAEKFEEASNELMETYPDFFDKDGFTMMWGRSCIYRFAAVSPFDANFLLKNPKADPGRARRICSGSLLQFLQRDDFLINHVPSLGFYGQFMPLVQGYSCAESVYWLGKAFLCLHLPADHPFWTAKENNGDWDETESQESGVKDNVKVTTLDGPALCFSNHKKNGTTLLRTGKVVKAFSDEHGMWNYSKLTFNSKYPWESGPLAENAPQVALSQQYILTDGTTGDVQKCNVTFWHGERDGVLYRRQFFNYNLENECHWINAMNLADIPVNYGILRIDKMRLFRPDMTLTLGAFGFPDNGKTEIMRKDKKGRFAAKAIILKGYDSQKRKKQLAMTIYKGWQKIDVLHSTGTNPDSANSIVVYGKYHKKHIYDSSENYVLISQVITKESHEDFTDNELFPIESIKFADKDKTGAYGNIDIKLHKEEADRAEYSVCFDGIESRLML
ncbi:MAG: DUF2264 domain-containing protein [Butyrivibrio sp.]|nr:DUF2264 domain-containing protein [Butyrivibrio sp.]